MTIKTALRCIASASLLAASAVLPQPVAAAPNEKPASSLPGGASSLQETYEDWVVACVQQGTVKKCSQAQVQSDQQSRQRILSIEVAPQGDKVEGLMILPFGLLLEKGAIVQVDDDGASAQSLKFRTCLPLGCVVPISFDAAGLAKLKKGTSLKVKAVSDANGQELDLAVSLKGFGTALERTTGLMK